MDKIVQQTVDALRRGATILYPTDTIWGIGCDARNRSAVERLYAIKERDRRKSMLLLAAEGTLPPSLRPPDGRPTTYVLPASAWRQLLGDGVADNLAADDGSLGIRVPRHRFCQEVIKMLGAPIVSTSANLSGRPSPASYADIEPELMQRVDYCVPPLDELLSAEVAGSRIVKLQPDGSLLTLRP